jgi:hypothetical protein
MIKHLTCFPLLSRHWEEVPKTTAEDRRSWQCANQEPYGLLHCPISWGNLKGRVKGLADCWDYRCQASRGGELTIRYDSDSFQIAIDNCGTSCFTNSMTDFIGTPMEVATKVAGIGEAMSTHVGTVRWLIVDDSGSRHKLLIPGTRFQKLLPFQLLCPQHVAQVYKDLKTTCLTLMDKVIFVWGRGKWKRTLALHKSSNVRMMWSAPSNHKFYAYVAQFSVSHIIPDNEEEEEEEEGRSSYVSGKREEQESASDGEGPTINNVGDSEGAACSHQICR